MKDGTRKRFRQSKENGRRDRAESGGRISCLMALEPRIMFDGAMAVSAVDVLADPADPAADPAFAGPETAPDSQPEGTDFCGLVKDYVPPRPDAPEEIIFVDPDITDLSQLLGEIPARARLVVLDPDSDALAQISGELARHTGLEAVHIVSHGNSGRLEFASGTLDLTSLADDAELLRSWQGSLSEEGDVILYGCEVAAGEKGYAFIHRLAELTGADVAASTDTTGHHLLGGDWDLEAVTGEIQTAVPRAFQTYTGILGDVPMVDSGQLLGSSNSSDIAFGDLDRDGDLDAFIANNTAPNKVWLNNGSGTFVDSGQNLGSDVSTGVSLGDVDGDGDLDAFVTNNGTADTVWLNDGSGVFTDSGQNLGSSNSSDVALADLDSDGDLDALVVNTVGQANTVWLNSGSGVFSLNQNLGSSSSSGVALADLDRDGDLDAFVANSGAGEANRVWFNDGTATFADSGQSLGSSISTDVLLADLDSDGDTDAFVTNFSGQGNTVWLNTGSGSFLDSGQSLGNSDSRSAGLADLDRDGSLDVIVVNENGANTVWLNDGTAGFTDTGQSLGVSSSYAIGVADLDHDGDSDAMVANYGQPNTVWFNNTLPWSVTVVDTGQSLGTLSSRDAAFGDLDGDGLVDVIVANTVAAGNTVWFNNGGGMFVDSGQSLGSGASESIELADLDGDGDLDAFVANNNGEGDRVWFNNGSGIFSDSGQSLGSDWSKGLALGDLDSDGDIDAYVTAQNTGGDRVWLNNGAGMFTDNGQFLGADDGYMVALGDVDGDGDLDAFVANQNGANKVWINTGAGLFSDSGQNLGTSWSWDAALVDVDLDGDLDAFVVNQSGESNKVWFNNGAGVFTDSGQNFGAVFDSEGLAMADIDGDGDADAVVANQDGDNELWINDGSGNYANSGLYLGGDASEAVAVADLDSDGDLDLFFANASGNTVFKVDRAATVTAGDILYYTENDAATVIDSAVTLWDPDGTDMVGAAVSISTNYANGEDVLAFTDTGTISGSWDPGSATLTLTGTDSQAAYMAALSSVTYVNLSDNPSVMQRTVSFSVHDGAQDSNQATSTVDVLATNDAPVLTAGTPTLLPIDENDFASPGDLIENIVSGLITDVDQAPLEGIAVTAVDMADGTWEYTLDNGTSWTAFTGTESDSFATLLAADGLTRIRFVPNADYNGFSDFTFRAWDQLDANPNGSTGIDVSVNGGQTSYSTDFLTASITINPVNSAPLVTSTGLVNYIENDPATVIDPSVGVSDPDSPTISSAKVQISANYAEGEDVLAFTDTGTIFGSWDAPTATLTLTGTDTATAYALALSTVTYENVSDNPSVLSRTVSFSASDGSLDSTVATSTVNVTATNDAPVLAGGTSAFTGIAENNFTNGGDPVETIIAGLITDVDEGPLQGIAVIGLDTANGSWQYSLDNGATWTAFSGGESDSFATLLAADGLTRIRFVPTADYVGDATLTFRAWDQLDGNSNGSTGIDVSVNGGGTAYSTNTVTSSITVNDVNYPPSVSAGGELDYTENDTAKVINPAIAVADVDSSTLVGAQVRITANYAEGEDVLAFSGGGAISASWDKATATLTLTGNAPPADYAAALSSVTYVNLSDNPSDLPRTVGFTVNDGIYDSTLATSIINVTATNDAPQLESATAVLSEMIANTVDGSGDAVAALTAGLVTDPDETSPAGIAVTGLDTSHGSWQYSLDDGATWKNFSGTESDGSATLLAGVPATRIRFVPDVDFTGSATITFLAWDLSDGLASGATGVNIATTGGESPYSATSCTASVTVTAAPLPEPTPEPPPEPELPPEPDPDPLPEPEPVPEPVPPPEPPPEPGQVLPPDDDPVFVAPEPVTPPVSPDIVPETAEPGDIPATVPWSVETSGGGLPPSGTTLTFFTPDGPESSSSDPAWEDTNPFEAIFGEDALSGFDDELETGTDGEAAAETGEPLPDDAMAPLTESAEDGDGIDEETGEESDDGEEEQAEQAAPAAVAAPVTDAPAQKGPARDGGVTGLSGQLAREQQIPEAERAKIMNIFEQVYELLQCK